MAILFHGHQDLLDRVMTEPLFSWGWNKGQDHSDPKRGRHGDSLRPGMCLVCLCSSEISSFWQQEGLIAERLIEWLNNWRDGKRAIWAAEGGVGNGRGLKTHTPSVQLAGGQAVWRGSGGGQTWPPCWMDGTSKAEKTKLQPLVAWV